MRPLILISNDDGVEAKGLKELIEMLREEADLIIVAPDRPRSGSSTAITSSVPVSCQLVDKEDGLLIYSCTGTPTDCVKLAFDNILPRKPDLLLSGINHGDNASVNIHYSGTMGAVFEGCILQIPSAGLSLACSQSNADFSGLKPHIHRLVRILLQDSLPKGVCLNVNFPHHHSISGMKVCRMAAGKWNCEWKSASHPSGKPYYWLTGVYENLEPEACDTDIWALEHGYISVVPVRIDMTAFNELENIKNKLE